VIECPRNNPWSGGNLLRLQDARYRNLTVLMQSEPSLPLRLALVGMSGTGKSFWTKKLATEGWTAISCDDRIERNLAPRLAAAGHSGINGVAAWMGWPDSAKYAEQKPEKPLVLDTTGSVIYTGNNLLLRLRRRMTVVYLAASAEEQQLLIERYLSDPKPVLWRGAFQPKRGESPNETVARCYPTLIAARRQGYEALAHCTLQVTELHDPAFDVKAFLSKIRSQLGRGR
jgi:shikimate kinase